MLLVVGGTLAAARPRQAAPLKFEIKAVDSATGKRKSRYFLGETVSIVFTLTNQDRRARTITELQDTEIRVKLISLHDDEDTLDAREGVRGGTSGSYVNPNGTIEWTAREPRKLTLSPGQSVSVTIDDLGRFFARRLQNGNHTFTAVYNYSLKAAISFRIVIDEAKSIPLLEKMAAQPVRNGAEDDGLWASIYLRQIRQPSISGRVTDTGGKPLKGVRISVTGSEKTGFDTRSNGRYNLTQMTKGGTYTLTPSLHWFGKHSEANYTFDPPSRTVTNLQSKLTSMDFTATRVRASTNVAYEDEGAKATASSVLDENDNFLAEYVLDGFAGDGLGRCSCGGWSDATPAKYPDWVEINFKGTRTIDWINVFTLPDNFSSNPGERDLNQTFSKYGITDFDVQYWNGRVWENVPGGAIRGNRNVWRKIAFPTITTNKIRVVVRNALDGHSRITEIEAFHINVLPLVKIMGRQKGRTGSKVQFRSRAFDNDGTIRRYNLDFGDNTRHYELSFGDKTARKVLSLTHAHTYVKAGTYTVTLSVIDDSDEASEASTTVTVTDPPKPPTADAAGPYEGIVGGDVFFEGRASFDPDGRIVRYQWSFGDGTTGTGPTALHKYIAPGTYKVTLLVIDNDGQSAHDTALCRITAPPPKPR
jgi:chitodextrinase